MQKRKELDIEIDRSVEDIRNLILLSNSNTTTTFDDDTRSMKSGLSVDKKVYKTNPYMSLLQQNDLLNLYN